MFHWKQFCLHILNDCPDSCFVYVRLCAYNLHSCIIYHITSTNFSRSKENLSKIGSLPACAEMLMAPIVFSKEETYFLIKYILFPVAVETKSGGERVFLQSLTTLPNSPFSFTMVVGRINICHCLPVVNP